MVRQCHAHIALHQYAEGKVSLACAAEIAGVDQESFKELLRETGIDRYIELTGDAFGDEVEQFIRWKAVSQEER